MWLTLMEEEFHDSRHLVEAGTSGGKGVQRLSVAHKVSKELITLWNCRILIPLKQ